MRSAERNQSGVVTLESSGTTGLRKRIFFTAEDQELARDFFAHGVAAMATEGDRMLIALPGEREGSVGFQLASGIARAGVVPIPYGLILDPTAALDCMDSEQATLLIGLPVQVLGMSGAQRSTRRCLGGGVDCHAVGRLLERVHRHGSRAHRGTFPGWHTDRDRLPHAIFSYDASVCAEPSAMVRIQKYHSMNRWMAYWWPRRDWAEASE
jgi:hypothetical protein